MKKSTRNIMAVLSAMAVMVAPFAHAADLYWDGGSVDAGDPGNGASAGGAGTWNTTLKNWDAGAVPHVAWINGNNDIAVFGGTAGTVTNQGVTVGGMTFAHASGTYYITNNTVTFGTAGAITNAQAVTISSILAGTGPITKYGAGTLMLSGNNSYTGGTVLNGGKIDVATTTSDKNAVWGANGGAITFNGTAATDLGLRGGASVTLNRGITVTNGATASIWLYFGNTTISEAVMGDGTLTFLGDSGNAYLNASANTFTGPLQIDRSGVTGWGPMYVYVASLADTTNRITFLSNSGGSSRFGLSSAAVAPLVLTNRVVELAASGNLENKSSSYGLTINRDLLVTGAGAKTVSFVGGLITFGGRIADGSGAQVTVSRSAGTVYLSGTNTYSGTTENSGNSALVFQGQQAVSSASTINMNTVYQSNPTITLLDDGAGTVALGNNVNIRTSKDDTYRNWVTFIVGNNNTANGGTSAGTTTGSTIALGNLSINDARTGGGTPYTTQGYTINIQGSNGYGLQFDNVNLPIVGTTGSNQILVPTSAPLTITGIIKQFSGNTAGRVFPLELAGTAVSNLISGAIKDADDYPVNANARPLSVIKSSSSTWTLSGTNTYSGATTVSGGKLVGVVGSSCSNSAVTVSGGTLGISVTDTAQQWACAGLTHTAASTLEFTFGGNTPSTTVAPLQVNGNVVFAVAPTVICTNTSLSAGTYPLVKWTGAFSGVAPSSPTLPSGFTGLLVLDQATKTLWLSVSASGSSKQPLTWKGAGDKIWVANELVYTKWQDAATPTPVNTNYQETTVSGITVGDNVIFGTTGAGTVTLNTNVSPASVTVNANTPNNYTISGTGSIGGAGGLTKTGTGTLTLSTTNGYSGGTSLGAGTLSIGINDTLGTGPVVLSGGTIQSSDSTARTLNNPVVLNGSSIVGGSGNLSFTSPGAGSVAVASTLTVNGSLNATFATALSGSGALTKAGTGTMTLTGTNTYSGGTTVSAGTLVFSGGRVTNTASAVNVSAAGGTMVITNGGTLFTSSGATVGTIQIFGGGSTGPTSTWNLSGNTLTIANRASSGTLTVNGSNGDGSAVITNVSNLYVGYLGGGSGNMVLTNGAQAFAGSVWLGYAIYPDSSSANKLTIVGGSGAKSILNAGGGTVNVGYQPNRINSDNNLLTIDAGGILTNASAMLVGWAANRVYNGISGNRLVVTNGGQLFTTGNSFVGEDLGGGAFSGVINNSATVSGANSADGVRSLWNLGGANLTVGYGVGSLPTTNNLLTVSAGGVVTNSNALIVKANNTLSLGAGGLISANAVTNSGTLAVGLDKNATPSCGRLAVNGNLNVTNARLDVSISGTPTEPCVIASYSSLTGAFAVTNGLPDKYKLDMNYKGNQIAIVYTAAGTIIQLR